MSGCSSQCGTNGHSSCTYAGEYSPAAVAGGSGGGGEIMLFGVRVKVDPMRKSVSLNNLSQYELPNVNNSNNGGNNDESSKVVVDDGYASADDAVPHHSTGGRERKRGVPWTEEEHKLFLLGLQKVGKGDWRGISRNFVKTRTPTQVASHAQKYFLRRTNLNRRRRRSSLFDITTDSVSVIPKEEKKNLQEHPVTPVLRPTPLPTLETSKMNAFPVVPVAVTVGPLVWPSQIEKPMESWRGDKRYYNASSTMVDFNLNQSSTAEPSSLSLNLSLSLDQSHSSPFSSNRHSTFQEMSNISNGEIIISVA